MRATVVGGAKGFGGGLAFALPVSYLLNQRWPYYRQLPPSLKAFGVILVAVPAFVINAEHGGLKYEKEHWYVATSVRRSCRHLWISADVLLCTSGTGPTWALMSSTS